MNIKGWLRLKENKSPETSIKKKKNVVHCFVSTKIFISFFKLNKILFLFYEDMLS